MSPAMLMSVSSAGGDAGGGEACAQQPPQSPPSRDVCSHVSVLATAPQVESRHAALHCAGGGGDGAPTQQPVQSHPSAAKVAQVGTRSTLAVAPHVARPHGAAQPSGVATAAESTNNLHMLGTAKGGGLEQA